MIPLQVLCDQCAGALSLGPDGEQSIIDFWDRHSLVINRDQQLDRLLMSIKCEPASLFGRRGRTPSTRLVESCRSYGSCASYDAIFIGESTELIRSGQGTAEAGSQANLHEFFFVRTM